IIALAPAGEGLHEGNDTVMFTEESRQSKAFGGLRFAPVGWGNPIPARAPTGGLRRSSRVTDAAVGSMGGMQLLPSAYAPGPCPWETVGRKKPIRLPRRARGSSVEPAPSIRSRTEIVTATFTRFHTQRIDDHAPATQHPGSSVSRLETPTAVFPNPA